MKSIGKTADNMTDSLKAVSTAVANKGRRYFNRQAFLHHYLKTAEEVEKEFPGYYKKEKEFVEEFLDHPERFVPTEHSIQSAYCDFVLRPAGGEYVWPAQVGRTVPLRANALRNVSVHVEYRYSSTMGCDSPVVVILAEVERNGEWEALESGGVAFCLRNFVQLAQEANPAQTENK